eukprot:scaffold4170_cov63-Phaeocystis_antarctica.AAC.8
MGLSSAFTAPTQALSVISVINGGGVDGFWSTPRGSSSHGAYGPPFGQRTPHLRTPLYRGFCRAPLPPPQAARPPPRRLTGSKTLRCIQGANGHQLAQRSAQRPAGNGSCHGRSSRP